MTRSYSNAQVDSANGVPSELHPNQSPIGNEVRRYTKENQRPEFFQQQGEELNIQCITNYRVSTISAFNIHTGFFLENRCAFFYQRL